MQKGFAHIFLLIVVLVALAGAAYYFGFDHGFEKSVKTSEQAIVSAPSSGANYKQLDLSETWIKHEPTCKLLANKIEIFHPDNWLPKDIDDTRNDVQACHVLFGYPVEPGLQDSPANLLAQFRIHAFARNEETFEQYVDAIKNQDPKPLKVSEIMINGQEFTKFDFEKKCCADSSVFYTTNGDIIFVIRAVSSYGYLSNPKPSELDPAVIEFLNNEFLKRIKFL